MYSEHWTILGATSCTYIQRSYSMEIIVQQGYMCNTKFHQWHYNIQLQLWGNLHSIFTVQKNWWEYSFGFLLSFPRFGFVLGFVLFRL